MDKKTFINISKEECLIVYKDMLANSDNRWNSAKILAENGDYGLAISMSIISVEEMVKAIIILLDGKGFEFRKIKGIETFFRNHEIRYVIAYFMFIISVAGDELMKWIKNINENSEKAKSFFNGMKKDGFLEKRYTLYFLRKFILLKQELDWFSRIDLFRQEGFYCDYKETLKSPIKISKKDFIEVEKRLEKVRKIGVFLLQELPKNEMETEKQIQELKVGFKEKRFYDMIAKSFEKLRINKKRPFEVLKEIVNNK